MRMLIITMAMALCAATGFAADNDAGKTSQKDPVASDVKKSSKRKSTSEKKTPEWPRPYKSTEKISVDSIVPFPTDI